MSNETAKEIWVWATAFGKTVKQRNVHQETCSYKAATWSLYAYEKQQDNTDAVDFAWAKLENDDIDTEYSTDSEDIDGNTSDETSGGKYF